MGATPESLQAPTAFAAADVISRGADGRIEFHYAIIEVAARVQDPQAVPRAADDVDDVRWVSVHELAAMKGRQNVIIWCHARCIPIQS